MWAEASASAYIMQSSVQNWSSSGRFARNWFSFNFENLIKLLKIITVNYKYFYVKIIVQAEASVSARIMLVLRRREIELKLLSIVSCIIGKL